MANAYALRKFIQVHIDGEKFEHSSEHFLSLLMGRFAQFIQTWNMCNLMSNKCNVIHSFIGNKAKEDSFRLTLKVCFGAIKTH